MSSYRPTGFQVLPFMVKNLIIINVIVFALRFIMRSMNIDLDLILGLNYGNPYFKWYQFVSYMFMHGSIGHIFFNMFALWMFGNLIENVIGPKRFLIFYLVCGLGAAALQILTQHLLSTIPFGQWPPMVGASGSVFGILFAFGYMFPNMMLYIYFLFPVRAKYFVAFYAAIELWAGISNNPGDNVAHFAHLGGMVFGFILLKIWGIRRQI